MRIANKNIFVLLNYRPGEYMITNESHYIYHLIKYCVTKYLGIKKCIRIDQRHCLHRWKMSGNWMNENNTKLPVNAEIVQFCFYVALMSMCLLYVSRQLLICWFEQYFIKWLHFSLISKINTNKKYPDEKINQNELSSTNTTQNCGGH